MKSASTAKRTHSQWGALAFAAGLACSASGSLAAAATASVTYIQVCAHGVDPNSGGCLVNPNSSSFLYAVNPGSQSWNLAATNAGALPGGDSNIGSTSPPSANLNEVAQTPASRATAQSFEGALDPTTQQTMPPIFTVTADAARTIPDLAGSLASGRFNLSGAFCLAEGGFACNASGDITFTIFYELLVDAEIDQLEFARAAIDIHADVGGDPARTFAFGDTLQTMGGPGSRNESFTFTLSVLANESVSFDFTGNALAQVPEPTGFALAALGLVAVGASRRRRSHAVPVV